MKNIPTPSASTTPIQVQGNVGGPIVYGDNNFVVNLNYGTIVHNAPHLRVNRHTARPLPPRPPLNFLDRSVEVQQASKVLIAHQPLALYGMEGSGKTTLLKQLANLLPPEIFPDGVVMVDGEWETLATSGLDDLVQKVFDALFDSDPPLKVTLLTARTYLSSVKILLLLDHLPLSANSWAKLPDLFPAGSLLWTIPRTAQTQAAQELALSGLPPGSSARLFLNAAGLDTDQTVPDLIRHICERLDHLPLALVIAGRWMRVKRIQLPQVLGMLTAQPSAEKNPVNLVLGAITSSLSAVERDLVSLVATAGGPTVDRVILIQALQREPGEAEAALDQLEAIGLLQSYDHDMGMHPAYKAFARRQLPADDLHHSHLAQAILAYVESRQGSPETVRGQLGNLLGVLDYGLRAGKLSLVAAAARLAAPQLVLSGKWDLWREVFTQIAEAAGRGRDDALLGRALHELGTRQLAMGDRGEAVRLLTQARDIRLRIGDRVGAAYSQHNLTYLLGPPPPGRPPSPGTGTPWLPILIVIGLGGVGLFMLAAMAAGLFYYMMIKTPTPRPFTNLPPFPSFVPETEIPFPSENFTDTPPATFTNTPTTVIPTTAIPTTAIPTTVIPTTVIPTTAIPTTIIPTTAIPTTIIPTTAIPPPTPLPVGQILFTSGRGGNREIYMMNTNGSGVTRLTFVEGDDNRPDLSPNGEWIAFDSERDGGWDVYYMDNTPRGTAFRLTGPAGQDFNPDWSPDGELIAFESNRDGDAEIFVSNTDVIDGPFVTQLTENADTDVCPDWSPDGGRIAFTSDRDGNREIYVMSADGSDQIRLTNNPALDNCPTWSPDGREIAFRSNRDGDDEIFIMNADGTNVRQLTRNTSPDWSPASWSPDGHWLAFLSQRDGNWEIYIVSADGISEINLTNNSSYDAYPSWIPYSPAIP